MQSLSSLIDQATQAYAFDRAKAAIVLREHIDLEHVFISSPALLTMTPEDFYERKLKLYHLEILYQVLRG